MIKPSSKQTKRAISGNMNRGAESDMDNDLHRLFVEELADIYNAEQQLTKALPKMVEAAEGDELRQALESHLEETEGHVTRLEEVCEKLGERLEKKTCAAMKGLIEEAQDLMKEEKNSSALDAALIAAAQKVEHYEIASYGTVCAWADQMGHNEALELLRETLEEERAADEKLTSIARSMSNVKAQRE